MAERESACSVLPGPAYGARTKGLGRSRPQGLIGGVRAHARDHWKEVSLARSGWPGIQKVRGGCKEPW